MEMPMSFQLPANPLASISKLPFVGKLSIASMGNLPKKWQYTYRG